MKIIILLLLIYIPAISQDTTEIIHPIDAEMNLCLELDTINSSRSMSNCALKALDEWELEIERNLNTLFSLLKENEKDLLIKSQSRWKDYKISEFNLIDELYSTSEGTIYLVIYIDFKMEFLKSRALELKKYINTINIDD